MADIFISYKREDQSKAKALANALADKGWSVWWDPKLRAGEHFDDAIEEALKAAKCVIVLWTELSVKSRYVKNEASRALKQKKLIPVGLDEAEPPLVFENLHAVQMQGWNGAKDSAGFRELVEQLQSKIGGGTLAAAASASVSSRSPEPTSFGSPFTSGLETLNSIESKLSDSRAKFRLERRQKAGKPVSPEQVGSDERSLLRLHVAIRRAWDSQHPPVKPVRGLGASEPPGFDFLGCPYGILTRLDLQCAPDYDFEARQLLRKLDSVGGAAIDYTPEQLRDLPENLQERGLYLLLITSEPIPLPHFVEHRVEKGPLRITQDTFDRYSQLPKYPRAHDIYPYYEDPETREVRELATRLGLLFKPK
jgi:hypothetical protein